MSGKGWVITTSGKRSVKDIAKDLTEAGFTVGQVLGEFKTITGSADDDIIDRLRSIAGVADVSPDHPIDIGPPDAPITW